MDTPSPRPSRTPSSINLNRLDLEKNTPDSTLPSSSASSTRNSKSEKNKDGAHSGLEAVVVDDVFTADIDGDGPDYRGVAWPGAFVLLLKSQVGLGVLSLPHVLNSVGYVPGMLLILVLGVITTYGDYEIGRFGRVYGGVHSVGDVGYILAGVWGREILGWSYMLYQCFIGAGGILASSIALNAVTSHATCTVAFAVTAAVVIGCIASARTFKQISWVGWVGISSILPAIFIVTIASGLESRPAGAPPTGFFDKELKAFNTPTFGEGMLAVVVVLFAYGGSPGFFSIIAEMKDPRDYSKAMFAAQGLSMAIYVSISTVLWYYCGQYVTSPALGSAGPLIKKIAYGVAIPGLLAGPIIAVHSSSKFCFVRLLRGSHHLQHSTPTHWITWLGLVAAVVSSSFIIAEVIPFFNDLIGLIGAVFASFFCITIFGIMWLYDNKVNPKAPSLSNKLLYANAIGMICIGMFIMGAGLWATIISIQASFTAGTIGSPFSCADNSG
ncbi:transmembrane amino acid transporter [Mrakia frigida]|uniref:transmembrane amino acid transporter n=1 Tax=Mrakia frigida TaxID=29902 RepID=UPI003FCC07F0